MNARNGEKDRALSPEMRVRRMFERWWLSPGTSRAQRDMTDATARVILAAYTAGWNDAMKELRLDVDSWKKEQKQ